ncbi:porin family protein [Ekhidna sp.]|uniref:porin family protein n=1 Tax=Ekhidna sp. TaxID=2608089 RepID=UPI00329A1FE3
MKNLLQILLFGIALSGFSQTIGIKGGLNLGKEKATASGITITSQTNTSFMVGLYSEYETSEDLFFSPELIFSIDGGKFEFFGASATDRFTYISAPLLMKYYATEKFSLHAGPQIGVLLKGESEVDGMKEDFKEFVKPLNLSFDFGAEVHLSALNFGFRYVLGLSNLNDAPDLDGKIRLNSVQIYLAFPLTF